LEEGFEYVVDIDLEKFFDRVNHDRLMARLAERMADRRLLKAIRKMLTAQVLLPDGVVVRTEEGTPQGGPLSPLLANIVLDELDRELARRGHRFVRYADDCNIYVRSERAGQRVMESVCAFIEKRLRLKVNSKKSAVARPQDRHFVGFRLRRNSRTGEVDVLLSQRTLLRVDEKIRALTPRNWGSSMRTCIERVSEYLVGWIGFFHIVTEPEWSTLCNLDGHLRRRLRCIKLRQWGRKRNIAQQFRRRGFDGNKVWKAIKDQGLWAISGMLMTNSAIRNHELESMGLVSLADRWRRGRAASIAPTQLTLALG
jgi:group II intron reverse transcriptase/maturase